MSKTWNQDSFLQIASTKAKIKPFSHSNSGNKQNNKLYCSSLNCACASIGNRSIMRSKQEKKIKQNEIRENKHATEKQKKKKITNLKCCNRLWSSVIVSKVEWVVYITRPIQCIQFGEIDEIDHHHHTHNQIMYTLHDPVMDENKEMKKTVKEID